MLPPATTMVAGRVVLRPAPDRVRLDDGVAQIDLYTLPAVDLEPGDLVRADVVADGDSLRAVRLERVMRPMRAPFGAGTETGAMLGSGLRARLGLRARVLGAVRRHLGDADFLEVETPSVVVSPGLDVHLHAFGVADPTRSHAGWLITSPEYHMKRLLVGGVPRCFQFARCFRGDEAGRMHEPEFTMLEWYRAWGTMDALLADTEAIVRAAADVGPEGGVLRAMGHAVRVGSAFDRWTVREAFARFAPDAGDPIELAARDESRFFAVLVDRIEPQLGRERPAFLTHYPASQASLARIAPDDPTVCERAELYVNGVELSNGFVELTDPVEQRARLERDQRERAVRGLPVYPIDTRFLAALEEGMPPSVGNALGMDRLIALIAGTESIAEVQAFSSARK